MSSSAASSAATEAVPLLKTTAKCIAAKARPSSAPQGSYSAPTAAKAKPTSAMQVPEPKSMPMPQDQIHHKGRKGLKD